MGRLRQGISRGTGAITLLAARLAQAGTTYLIVPVLAAIALGSAIWFAKPERLKGLETNKVTYDNQKAAAFWVALVLGALVLGIVGHGVWSRVKKGSFRWPSAFARVGALSTAFIAAPFAVALFQPTIEKDSPKLAMFYAGLVALAIGVAVYRSFRDPPGTADGARADDADAERPASKLRERAASVASWLAVVGLWLGYGWFFTKLSITNHHALTTRTIDLGYYDNIFWQSIHGHPLACTFIKAGYHGSAHFDPILVLLSPIYLLYPRAELILGLQSFWVGAGVIPVFLIARHHLGSRFQSVLFATTWALHPAVHGANMYEFHSLTLAATPMMFALYFLLIEKKWAYWIAFAACLLVREDLPLMMCMVGAWAILRPNGKLRGTGVLTIALSLVYFVVVKKFFMTSSGVIMSGPEAYSYAYYYEEMIPGGKGIGGLLLSLFTNPAFVVAQAFEEVKVEFLVTLFLPLLFLPFAGRGGRILLVYGLMFCLLASRTAVFSTHFQYTNTILPFAFFVAPDAMRQLADGKIARAYGLSAPRLQRALAVAALFASLGVSFKFGGIVENKSFKGGFYPVVRELGDEGRANYAFIQEMIAKIPKDASVAASNRLGPHISNRREAYFYGQKPARFILVDERELKPDRKAAVKKALAEGRVVEVGRRGAFVMYENVDPKKAAAKKAADENEDNPLDVLGDPPQE
jgi:uncharacterized membrane protein